MIARLTVLLGALALSSCSDGSLAGKPVVDETTNGIVVRLTLPDGAPAAGARVAVAATSHLAGDSAAVFLAFADGDGQLELPRSLSGHERIEVRWNGWGLARTLDELEAGRVFQGRLLPMGVVTVRTVPGARVRAYGCDRVWNADSLGKAVLDSLPPGSWSLRADVAGSRGDSLVGEQAVSIASSQAVTVDGLDSVLLDPDTWPFRSEFLVEADPAGSLAALSDVPVPVRIGGDAFATGLAAPGDLRILDARGRDLPFEVDEWDAIAGHALVWVSLPTAHPAGGDTLVLLWGKPGLPARDPVDLTSSVTLSLHLGELPQGIGDSGTSSAAGILGKARGFSGTDWLQAKAPSDSLLGAGFTLSCWVLADAIQRPWAKIVDLGSSGAPFGTVLLDIDSATGRPGLQMAFADGTWKRVAGTAALSGWVHLAARWEGPTRRATFFVDGISQGSLVGDTTLLSVTGHDLMIGNQEGGADGLSGSIDELRWEPVARSDAWIRHQAFVQAAGHVRPRQISP
jgi:hypothetical protein